MTPALPPIPPLADLQAMSVREVYTKLLRCCPGSAQKRFGEALGVASLHSHKLALPMLILELRRIRNADKLLEQYRRKTDELPNIDLIRKAFRQEVEHLLHPELEAREARPVYFCRYNEVYYRWTGPGNPEKGGGKWIQQNLHIVNAPDGFTPPWPEPESE